MPIHNPVEQVYTVDDSNNDNGTGVAPVVAPTGSDNIALGQAALDSFNALTDDENIAFGKEALKNHAVGGVSYFAMLAIGTLAGTSLTGNNSKSLLIGYESAENAADIANSIFLGDGSGNSADTVTDSIFIGSDSAASSLTSSLDIAIGSSAFQNTSNTTLNIGIGNGALSGVDAGAFAGDSNIGIGTSVLSGEPFTANAVSGDFNVALGDGIFRDLQSGSNNIGIGKDSGHLSALRTGSDGVYIGNAARSTIAGADNAVAIGTGARVGDDDCMALGLNAFANAARSIQIGAGTNSVADSVQTSARFRASGGIDVDGTNTGTVGAVTINKHAGRVNIAAATASLVVTNNTVTAASHVLAILSTNDATAVIGSVVPGAGSFTIHMSANATAQSTIDFFVLDNA